MVYREMAALLDYPGVGLRSALDACLQALDSPAATALEPFAASLTELAPGELEELYTRTFDLHPESCLYIGHHLFGEDWRRGMFMARLRHHYAERGFSDDSEVPDYLPIVLRFVAGQPGGPETEELLRDCVIPAVARILRVLEQKPNSYAAVLRALLLLLAPDENHRFEAEDLSCRPFSSSPFPILP